jgi:hypothetical protein
VNRDACLDRAAEVYAAALDDIEAATTADAVAAARTPGGPSPAELTALLTERNRHAS